MKTNRGRPPERKDGSRNVTLSVRITPKVRFGLEMVERLHRLTIPEIVSMAISHSLSHEVYGVFDYNGVPETGGKRDLMSVLWAERASDRFANVAFECQDLLSTPERIFWEKVKANETFWDDALVRAPGKLRREVLAGHWKDIGGERIMPSRFAGQTPSRKKKSRDATSS